MSLGPGSTRDLARVGTGAVRDTLASGRPQGRVGEDDILKDRYLCKRHIVCRHGMCGGLGMEDLERMVERVRVPFCLAFCLQMLAGMVPCPKLFPHHKVSFLFAWSPQSQRMSRVPPSAGRKPHRGN